MIHGTLFSRKIYYKSVVILKEVVEQLNRGQEHSVMEVKTKKKKATFPQFMSSEESNALKTWQKRMQERRKQQNYLSSQLF